MATLEQVLEYRNTMHKKSTDLIQKKGHDYNRRQQDSGDTLFNLRIASIMGIVDTPYQGVLVRLCDKMMRLSSLMAPGITAAVSDESIEDTIADIHNYADYAKILFDEENTRERIPDISPEMKFYLENLA